MTGQRNWGTAFVLMAFGLCVSPCLSWGRDDGGTLHVLLATDTDGPDGWARIGAVTGEAVKDTLTQEIPSHRLRLRRLGGASVTAENIVSRLRNLQISSQDALLVYVFCHGGTAPSSRQHYLHMADGKQFYRDDLMRCMRGKHARLTVLITESCANYSVPTQVFQPKQAPMSGRIDVCRLLFFGYRGVVDINAAREGVFAWGDEGRGGVFGSVFTRMLCESTSVLDANRDGVVDWHEFSEILNRGTDDEFKMRRQGWIQSILVGGITQSEQQMYQQLSSQPDHFIRRSISVASIAQPELDDPITPQLPQTGWTDMGTINGVRVYRDNASGLEWTQTLGTVPSADRGRILQMVAQHGFRLPTFAQLRTITQHGGHGYLDIRMGLFSYYATDNPTVLGNPHGNGFQSPQPPIAIVSHVIGVR